MWGLPLKRKTRRERVREARAKHRREKAERLAAHVQRRYWARFLGYVGRRQGLLAAVLVLVILSSALEIVLPQIVRFAIDHILPFGNGKVLAGVVFAGLGIYAGHAFSRYFEQKSVTTFAMNVMTDVRRDLFEHQLALPLSYFEKYGPGKLISKLTYSVFMLKFLIETFAYVCFREITLITLIVVAAAAIDWKLTLIVLAVAPVFVVYLKFLNRTMEAIAGQLQTKNDQILKILNRSFNAIRLFKVMGAEKAEVGRLDEVLQADKAQRIRRTLVYAANAIAVSFVTSALTLAALWYGGTLVMKHRLTTGELTAYLFYLGMLFRPVSEFIKASAYLQAGRVAVMTVFSVFENHEPVQEPERPVKPAKREGAVAFDNVWLTRSGGGAGLRGVNFKVKPGEKVLVIGPSGAGKSTLLNLLLRLYDPDRGGVRLDGVNLRRMPLSDVRDYFTVVTQDQMHADDSVLANLLLGDSQEPNLEETLRALGELGLAERVSLRERKLDQRIDGEGMGFSRGELQKFALLRAAARAAAKDTPVVLLDEPTASMDAASEKAALRFIKDAFAGKTVLMVSHRPHPLFRADWILLFRDGRLESQGTHHYLLKNSREYRRWLNPSGPDERSAPGP
jgi:subfamily B ATP-binding cassette protein MsbA